MENEKEETLNEDVETSENNEELETEEEEESNDSDDSEETNDNELTVEDYNKLKQTNKQLYQRLKKAEAQAKLAKAKPTNKTNNVSEEDLIRTAKLASQLDDDDLEVLQSLSGSLKEKIENPLFKAYKENKEKKLKSESASLKPSTGAKVNAPKANMTPEEHKAWVKKLMS